MTRLVIDRFEGKYRFLSNFWMQPFRHGNTMLLSVEHGYQALKATNEDDYLSVLRCKTPGQSKRAGNNIAIREDWDLIKIRIMQDLVESKFRYLQDLKEKLLLTGDAELIEGNHWGDRFWGKDLSGNGKNHLGKILMATRQELRMENIICRENG